MYRRILAIFFAIVMILPQTAGAQSNYQNHWAGEHIQKWMSNGWIRGYEDGSVKPDSMVTRAEFTTMINRAFGFTEKAEIDFDDVKSSDWFYDEIAKGVGAGYLEGLKDGNLRPYEQISRQEAIYFIYKIFEGQGFEEEMLEVPDIKDYSNVSRWASEAVGFGFENGIVIGDEYGYFRPQQSITRAEAMVIIDRANEHMERERERERDREPEDMDKEQEREQEREQAKEPESSFDHRAVYIIKKWVSGGDVYVEFEEYDKGVFEVKVKDLEFEEIDAQRPYIAKIRRSEMEIIKPDDSNRFDIVYGLVVEKRGDIMEVDTTPSNGQDDTVKLNNSRSNTVVYEEEDDKEYEDVYEGDYVWIVAESTTRPRVIEILTDEELNEDRDEPPYSDGY